MLAQFVFGPGLCLMRGLGFVEGVTSIARSTIFISRTMLSADMGGCGIYIGTLRAFCQMCVGYKTLSLMMILLIDYRFRSYGMV